MRRSSLTLTLLAALPFAAGAQPLSYGEEQKMTNVPSATTLTHAPLRNRFRVALEAPVFEVWSLIGDLARFPEYSAGLERVEAKRNSSGALTEYVYHFKPQAGEIISHREIIRWYEPSRGFASSAEEPNAFGLKNALTLVTLEPSKEGAVMTWDQYYDAEDLDMMRAEFDQALADIAERLIARFGGHVVERHVRE